MATEHVPEHDTGIEHGLGDYSRSTQRAHYIDLPDEHEGHPGESLVTRSHEVIRCWAEARNAIPATVEGTEHEGRPGVLRFDFPGFGEGPQGTRLKHISWDEWFRTFDQRELVFIFQEHMKAGNPSNFFKLDSPHREHE